MRKRSWFARLLVGGLVAGGLLVSQAPPSHADCIWVQAYITRANDTPYYVWNGCVYPTDWGWGLGPGTGNGASGLPSGTPNGFFVQVKIPVP